VIDTVSVVNVCTLGWNNGSSTVFHLFVVMSEKVFETKCWFEYFLSFVG
jgi:hypothetical protein